MKPHFYSTFLWIWIIAGVPMLHAVYYLSAYRYSLSRGYLPYVLFPEWLFCSIPLIFLLSGSLAILKAFESKIIFRILMMIAYSLIMLAFMCIISVEIGFYNGDSL